MKNILITGGAGFIGFHLASHPALQNADNVVLFDKLNSYYDPALKYGRLKLLGFDVTPDSPEMEAETSSLYKGWVFYKGSLEKADHVNTLFEEYDFDTVVNLGAQAGVRYSIDYPQTYADSNLQGFLNILEACRNHPVDHLIYASSSSVYGANKKTPFCESDSVDNPISLYAATKKSNELMAHSYSHLYGIPCTGLRFFTVYGPWGRPDMAYFSFAQKIAAGETIQIFNNGDMMRDFTYVEDISESITRLFDRAPVKDSSENGSAAPARILNIGHGSPVNLLDFVKEIEKQIGKVAQKEYLPMQMGDVPVTWADTSRLEALTGYKPKYDLAYGIGKFATWFKEYYKL
ncbi:MAG: hypothetical protein B6241_13300 [Spirochaetaceae bacterium 4572_59]|nr:MAG: hypothetical protein B6241_13300 [Spirochaetaceae bacterium 4572_59]